MQIIITTIDQESEAISMIKKLLEEKLIACGTLIPKAISLFYWENKLQEQREVIIIMKTISSLKSTCFQRIKQLHTYEIPEILALEPDSLSPDYLKWINSELNP